MSLTISKKLCDECRAESDSWLEYRPGRHSVKLVSIGDSVQNVQGAQVSKLTSWRETVKFQRNLIREHCNKHHT